MAAIGGRFSFPSQTRRRTAALGGSGPRRVGGDVPALRRGLREHRRADSWDAAVETPHDRARVRDARDARDAFLPRAVRRPRRARRPLSPPPGRSRFPGGARTPSRAPPPRALRLLRRRRAREVFGERGRARGDGGHRHSRSPVARAPGSHEREPEVHAPPPARAARISATDTRAPRGRALGGSPSRGSPFPSRTSSPSPSGSSDVPAGRAAASPTTSGARSEGKAEGGKGPRTRRARRTRSGSPVSGSPGSPPRAASRGDALCVDARFKRARLWA